MEQRNDAALNRNDVTFTRSDDDSAVDLSWLSDIVMASTSRQDDRLLMISGPRIDSGFYVFSSLSNAGDNLMLTSGTR